MIEQVKPKSTLWPLFVVIGVICFLSLGFLGLLVQTHQSLLNLFDF